ncbi:MAG TPA: hypothetical protein VMZ31_09290 [Phycisphaerae bacterium]|nr:hypothetical protein [Phycisphaerae bacterium]
MHRPEDVTMLVEEYRALLGDEESPSSEFLEGALARGGDWTPRAARHLRELVINYGSFMLRNALAISLALQTEDGELQF